MQVIKPTLRTTVLGMAAGIAAVLASGGVKGKRLAMPSARIMIHRGSASVAGSPSEIARHALEIRRYLDAITQILAENCGQSFEKISADTTRDYWMAPEEAVAYGIIDGVVVTPTDETIAAP